MIKIYHQVSRERYDLIMERYNRFQNNLANPDAEPVRVFDPLEPKLAAELEMIREISKELQLKKDEDMKKAAQAAESQEEENKKEETEETKEVEEKKE